jgi:hypothetical protein
MKYSLQKFVPSSHIKNGKVTQDAQKSDFRLQVLTSVFPDNVARYVVVFYFHGKWS